MPVTLEGVSPASLSRVATEIVAEALPMESNFIALQFAPPVYVDPKDWKGSLWREDSDANYGQGDFVDLTWADRAPFPELNQKNPVLVTYECESKGGKLAVGRRQELRSLFPTNLRDRNLKTLRRTMAVELERATASYAQDNANYGANTSTLVGLGGSGVKMGAAGDAPFGDLVLARDAFKAAFGYFAPAVTMGWTVYERLKRASDMRSYVGNNVQRISLPDEAASALIREVLNCNVVLVGSMPYNTADPADAKSLSDIWSDNVIFHSIGDMNAVERVSGGAEVSGGSFYTVIEDTPESAGDLRMEGYRWETEGGTKWDAAGYSRDACVDTGLGAYLVTDCI